MSDYIFHEKKTVALERVLAFEKALYMAAGMSQEDAACVAEALVDADARGVYSHGIIYPVEVINRNIVFAVIGEKISLICQS